MDRGQISSRVEYEVRAGERLKTLCELVQVHLGGRL